MPSPNMSIGTGLCDSNYMCMTKKSKVEELHSCLIWLFLLRHSLLGSFHSLTFEYSNDSGLAALVAH